MFVSDAV